MKQYYFFAGTLLITSVLFAGCGSGTNPKTGEPGRGETATQGDTGNKPVVSIDESASQSRQVLWDFRKIEALKEPKISKAESLVVAKYLFGDQANSEMEITSRVSGSFTKSGAKETLYFVTGCDEDGHFTTDCDHASQNSAGWIAIYDNTTPVMKLNEALGGEIVAVTDVNGDGINEILNFSGYGGQGIETSSAHLGQVSGDKYKNIQDFKGYADDCAESDDPTGEKAAAAVISYSPTTDGKMPTFTETHFEAKCGRDGITKNTSWKTITKKQFDTFFDSLS